MVPYAVAVFFQNATAGQTAQVSVSITGAVCPENQVGAPGGGCLDVTTITDLSSVQVPPNTTFAAYRFTLPSSRLTGSFTVSLPAGNVC